MKPCFYIVGNVESIWGNIPCNLKRIVYLCNIRSAITDSAPSKLGKEFTIIVESRKQDVGMESESDREVNAEGADSSSGTSVNILQLRAETAEIRLHWTDAFKQALLSRSLE